jgi:hypothetical protein
MGSKYHDIRLESELALISLPKLLHLLEILAAGCPLTLVEGGGNQALVLSIKFW